MIRYCGVVVLYNPEVSVPSNIDTYLKHLSKLYVIDNSEKINLDVVNQLSGNDLVEYINLNGNKGLANALNIGCEKAILEGFDYILTMDQDSKFENDAVGRMISFIESNETDIYSIVSPNVASIYTEDEGSEEKVAYTQISDPMKNVEKNWVMTSGSLMNLNDYKNVGGFDESLFIAHIDIDIGVKFNKLGKKIIQLGNALIYQRFGNSKPKKLLWKTVHPSYASPVRTYYLFRNQKYLEKKWKGYKGFIGVHLYKFFIKIVIYEPDKVEKIKMALKGLQHARRNFMGPYKDSL